MQHTPGAGIDLDRAVADALSHGDPNVRVQEKFPPQSNSLLMLVAINRRIDLTETLLKAGATMDAEEFGSVLWWWPDTEIVICLLAAGVPYNSGWCIEMLLRHGQWNLVEILLDHGADVNGVYRATFLLHIAVRMGEQAFLEGLLRRGADVHRRHPGGRTALMKACEFTYDVHKATPRMVETLLQHGSDPNAATAEGETSLLLCTAQKLPYLPERTEIARVLLKHGADPNWPSRSGTTPLMLAARDNNLPLATALIEAGASPHTKTADGRSVRDIAAQYKADDVLAFLQSLPE